MSADHDEHEGASPPAAGEVPNEDEVAREFPHGSNRPLREQRPLTDEDGDDIRQYTGEPVETEHGTVLPQQMAVGSERTVGGGEYPGTEGSSSDGSESSEQSDEPTS